MINQDVPGILSQLCTGRGRSRTRQSQRSERSVFHTHVQFLIKDSGANHETLLIETPRDNSTDTVYAVPMKSHNFLKLVRKSRKDDLTEIIV